MTESEIQAEFEKVLGASDEEFANMTKPHEQDMKELSFSEKKIDQMAAKSRRK
ncbi:MAG: hypothetical protein FD123_387 [Bacteroidetes bacterium]|nr:MAG: hypothetical protein FD123_387 [Bacteroidota bacterium]